MFMEIILLMNRINCLYNTPLQVLRNAPALHSLIIRWRFSVEDILKFLFHIRGNLRKLTFQFYRFGENSTDILANTVELHPDLESLSLERCKFNSPASYLHITGLKKLCELNLSYCEVC
jgi:hypothetical protein